jgi:hypothetical protein
MMESLAKTSFCLTSDEAHLVEAARKRLGKLGVLQNKSEVIRTAINCLAGLNDEALATAASKTAKLKPGRK